MSHYTAAYIMDAESSHRIAAALATARAGEVARELAQLRQIPPPAGYESSAFTTMLDYLATERRINLRNASSFVGAWPVGAGRFLAEFGFAVHPVMDAESAQRTLRLMQKYDCSADDCHLGINCYFACDARASLAAYDYLLTILSAAQSATHAWVAIVSSQLPI